jgi:hypothetical protein
MPTVGASKKAVHRGTALRWPPLYGGLDQPGPYVVLMNWDPWLYECTADPFDCDKQIVKALVTATNGSACCATNCRC